MAPRVDDLYVHAAKVPGVSCCDYQVSCLCSPRDKRVGQCQIPPIAMRPFPERSRPLGVATLDRQYTLMEVRLELGQPITHSVATATLRKNLHAQLKLSEDDYGQPKFSLSVLKKPYNMRTRTPFRKLRNNVGIQKVAGHSSSSSINGIGRFELRSGTSRFVPRGTFVNQPLAQGLTRRRLSRATLSPAPR